MARASRGGGAKYRAFPCIDPVATALGAIALRDVTSTVTRHPGAKMVSDLQLLCDAPDSLWRETETFLETSRKA
jgi:hypothetical protein